MSSATHIIDWKANSDALKPPLTIVTDPESILTGDSIKISLYSAYPHDLLSPYNGLGSKSVLPDSDNLPIDEIIDLSGSTDISAKFPIAELSSLVAAIAIVDETTRAVVVNAGMPLDGYFSVVNNQLKIKDDKLKLHGSVRLVYKTFNAQQWTHTAFTKQGKALLFAHNLTTLAYENVPLSIGERAKNANDSIKIEAWTSQPKQSFNPYHAVVIYPADKKYIIKADYGTVVFRQPVTHTIKAEEVTFGGKEATTSYPITKLGKVTGVFFDANLNEIEPTFRLSDGVIKCDVECYGFAIVDYDTSGLVYDYNADVKVDLVTHKTTITIGYVIAQEKGKVGIGASYKVPIWQSETKKPVDFYTVTRKVLAQSATTFEYPPNWANDDNTYPNLPGASAIPEVGSGFATAVVVESGYVDSSGSIDYDTHSNAFYDPYAGSPTNPDAIYEIQTSIPSEIVDTSLITTLEEKINEAKERWGIV